MYLQKEINRLNIENQNLSEMTVKEHDAFNFKILELT